MSRIAYPSKMPSIDPGADELFEGATPPSPARLLALAGGLVEMTEDDRRWLETHPELVTAQRELQAALCELQDAIVARQQQMQPAASSAITYDI